MSTVLLWPSGNGVNVGCIAIIDWLVSEVSRRCKYIPPTTGTYPHYTVFDTWGTPRSARGSLSTATTCSACRWPLSGTVVLCCNYFALRAAGNLGSGVPIVPRSAVGLHVNSTEDVLFSVFFGMHALPIGGSGPQCARSRAYPSSSVFTGPVRHCAAVLAFGFFFCLLGCGSAGVCCYLSLFRRCYYPVM